MKLVNLTTKTVLYNFRTGKLVLRPLSISEDFHCNKARLDSILANKTPEIKFIFSPSDRVLLSTTNILKDDLIQESEAKSLIAKLKSKSIEDGPDSQKKADAKPEKLEGSIKPLVEDKKPEVSEDPDSGESKSDETKLTKGPKSGESKSDEDGSSIKPTDEELKSLKETSEVKLKPSTEVKTEEKKDKKKK